MLGISEEEAKGVWAILAAICHLGCAGVAVGKYTIYLNLCSCNGEGVGGGVHVMRGN